MSEEELRAITGLRAIIQYMVANKKFNDAHVEDKRVMKIVKNIHNKKAERLIKKFIKKSGWIQSKKSTQEPHYSLTMKKLPEISEFLECSNQRAIEMLRENI